MNPPRLPRAATARIEQDFKEARASARRLSLLLCGEEFTTRLLGPYNPDPPETEKRQPTRNAR